MTLTKQDVHDVISQVLEERRGVDQATHLKHHQFIELQIEELERKKRLRESVKKQVIGWGVIVVLGGIGTAVYRFVVDSVARVHS